jgi:hypothetical protein
MIDLDMGCAVCGHALAAVTRHGQIVFEHPVVPQDHEPQPRPAHTFDQLYRRCHLCSLDQPLWIYRTGEIVAQAIGSTGMVSQSYATDWQVCTACADLIDAGDPAALTERCTNVMGWAPQDPGTLILTGIHRALISSRKPGRALVTTGHWPSAPLKVPLLPKIRDRLTGLLRGPVGLPGTLGPRIALAEGLEQARLYWIDTEFTDLVHDVYADLPATSVTGRIVPPGNGLLTWARPVDSRHHLAAASWTPAPGGWRIVGYRTYHPPLPERAMQPLRDQVGWLIPAHTVELGAGHSIDASDPLAALAATWLIIAQQLTCTDTVAADPAVHRSYRRAKRTPPEIHTIRIRSPRPPTAQATAAPTSRAQPDHRYWVSAHTRKQAHGPGRTLRREIDIDPFLKGPAGAPIKTSTTIRILGTRRP